MNAAVEQTRDEAQEEAEAEACALSLEMIGTVPIYAALLIGETYVARPIAESENVMLMRARLLDLIADHPVARRIHRDLVRSRRFRCRIYPYVWRVRTRLSDRYGQRCRVNARGALNSCEVEFEDGFTTITSRNYLRRARH